MSWTEEQKESFFKKGFAIFEETQLCDFIGDHFDLPNRQERLRDNFAKDLTPEIAARMHTASMFLREKYVSHLFPDNEFKKFGLWEGVDMDSTQWHNDFFEGMNCFFLLYFNDMCEETGGSIEFRWPGGEETHYPKRGMCVLLNQQIDFFHRATKATIDRYLASFDFYTPQLAYCPDDDDPD